MKKRIMLATDGSKYSAGAIKEAINFAKTCESQLYAMSAIEINPEFFALAPPLVEKTEKALKKHLEGIKNRAAKENVECEIIIREGEEPYRLIIEEADKKQAEMIVMGRRGRTGLTRLLMGSVTARVIGHATRKVLVVPRTTSIKWKNIVLATDGSKHSRSAEKEAVNLIKHCCKTCTLNVITVIQKSATKESTRRYENSLNRIKSNAEKENIKVETVLTKSKPTESIHEAIIEYSKEKKADIIVMGSHGRTGIKRLLMGSVAERVIGHTTSSVLVVKP